MYLDRVRVVFSGVDWAPFEAEANTLYNMEGRGRRPKPPLAYLKAALVKMLLEVCRSVWRNRRPYYNPVQGQA